MSKSYEPVIGLEIHAQLNTKSKIFCADSTEFQSGDNENVSPVSLGMPGTLPVLNKTVIEKAIKAGLALGCKINSASVFARKNYFYPDLPKGYQISQYDKPICYEGAVSFKLNGEVRRVGIERAHLEEDAGKSTHFGEYTLLNYNRAGIPLLEIVSKPEIKSATEAAEYAKAVKQLLKYVDVCDGNLEEGSFRCDCNVSVKPVGQKEFGVKVEIKNVNSFRFVEKAIEYEINRQIDSIERGEKIVQETRLWDPDKNKTFSMRTKEDAHDYRYFPDPDLLPVTFDKNYVSSIQDTIPELPFQKSSRFISELGLSDYDAALLTEEAALADYFEEVSRHSKNAKASANWILTEIVRELKLENKNISESKIKAIDLGHLIKMIDEGSISGKIAKTVFAEMWNTSRIAEDIIKEKGISQISDTSELEKVIDEIILKNPNQVSEFRSGKDKLMGFFVGQAMKATKGQANPSLLNSILLKKLKGE